MASAAAADAARAGVDDWYRRWGAEIHTYCSRLLGNQADADEVTQEVFLAALRQYPRLCAAGEPPHARAWLYRVAVNRCIDLRRRQRLLSWLPLARWHEPVGDADPVGEAAARGDLTRQALGKLSARDAALVLLSGAQGLTYREIAAVLGLSPAAASAAVSRSHRRFARQYAALAEEDGP